MLRRDHAALNQCPAPSMGVRVRSRWHHPIGLGRYAGLGIWLSFVGSCRGCFFGSTTTTTTTTRVSRKGSSTCSRQWPFLSELGFVGDIVEVTAHTKLHSQNEALRRLNLKSSRLGLSEDPNNDSSHSFTKKKKRGVGRSAGIYVRPSAAIERGSGFYVPGLEGPKIRLATGAVVLGLTAVNHYLSSSRPSATTIISNTSGNTFSELLAATFSIFVLVQAAIESVKFSRENEDLTLVDMATTATQTTETNETLDRITHSSSVKKSTVRYVQQWSLASLSNNDADALDWRDRVEWAGTTYLALTPATCFALLGPGTVLYWLGNQSPRVESISDGEAVQGCIAAIETISQSTTGCVSIPITHPTAAALLAPPNNHNNNARGNAAAVAAGATDATTESGIRSAVLQRVSPPSSQLCILMASNQLLASFSQRDLQWLGQLAQYIASPFN